jgi:YVTN family beta-propeller protein
MTPPSEALSCLVCTIRSVPVGVSPDAVAYDAGKNEVLVANYGSANVSIIASGAATATVTIPVGLEPTALAYDPARGEIFVANYGWNNVSVINDTTDTVVANVVVGTGPWALAYDSGRGEVFVANYLSSNVSVIDDATDKVVANIPFDCLAPVSCPPVALGYDPGKGEVFVETSSDSTRRPAFAGVINDTSNNLVANITVGYSVFTGAFPPGAVSFDSTLNEVLVANGLSGNVSVINASSNHVVAAVPAGSSPDGMAFVPSSDATLVASAESANLSIINDASDTLAATVNISSVTQGTAIAYDTGDGSVALAEESDHTVVFLAVDLTSILNGTPSSSPGTGAGFVAFVSGTTGKVVIGGSAAGIAAVGVVLYLRSRHRGKISGLPPSSSSGPAGLRPPT